MPNTKAFTLMELIIVIVILGILAAIAIPTYNAMAQQGAAKAAQANLIALYAAEKNFYINNGYYCTASSQNATCGTTTNLLNTNLGSNITDSNFSYSCTDPNSGTDGNNGSALTCTAANHSDAGFTLTLSGPPNQIILSGGTGCATPTAAGCNPVCADTSNPGFCSFN